MRCKSAGPIALPSIVGSGRAAMIASPFARIKVKLLVFILNAECRSYGGPNAPPTRFTHSEPSE